MIRGTTPTLQFTTPVTADKLTCLYLTIAQDDAVVVEKQLTDCDCNGATVTCKLSQAETLQLDASKDVEIQVRAKTTEGDAMASQIYITSVDRILKEGEI